MFPMEKTRKKINLKKYLKEELQNPNSSFSEKVDVELNVHQDKYDSSNPLVLTPESKTFANVKKVPKDAVKKKKPLSKKQKRLLAKIIEKKQRNINRSELLEKLQEVQATEDELKLITSTSCMQTFGLKRNACDIYEEKASKISSIKGGKKNLIAQPKKIMKLDPNVVGYESGDESSDDGNEEIVVEQSSVTAESIQNVEPVTLSENVLEENKDKDKTKNLTAKTKSTYEPAVYIPVSRTPEIQAIREALPIYSEEQAIMEAIRENPVVLIHGATGSGKTTQVPQFLYEAGYTQDNKLIGITEPRRIAAVQMASRVGEEMNLQEAVSYHIRYEKTATESKTNIKFMTDGVLLKEMRHDFLLTHYSVILIDEAHERSVFSDVLIGLLSRILPLREKKGNPLKLVIMSATLCVKDFTANRALFKQEPFLITLDSRQYDVVLHFNKRTPEDYVLAAYEKVSKIHRQLPSGAMLVFVTGEKEVTRLCKMLRMSFPMKTHEKKSKSFERKIKLPITKKKIHKIDDKHLEGDGFADLPKINLDDYSVDPLDNEGIQHQNSDDEAEEKKNIDNTFLSINNGDFEPLYVLPLYSMLPASEQAKIFKPPPAGCRLCVVATNVAETSITVPGLKYVVDTGKVKTRIYDKIACGVSSFAITWTSKASANQRAGRAGRTEGGHCYRLYSSAVFEHEFPEFTAPDIQRIPVDDIVLQMKSLGIDRVVNFPFPASPDVEALKAAEKRLVILGALQDLQKGKRFKDITKWEYSAKVTPLGKAMSRFPLSPCLAKMLLLSYKHDVMPYVIALVSAMTVPQVFLSPPVDNDAPPDEGQNSEQFEGIKKIGAGQRSCLKMGDPMVLLRAVALFEESRNQRQFCIKYNIRLKAMAEIHKMRLQLIREMNRSFLNLELSFELKLQPPNDEVVEKLRKILTSSFTDHIARKMTEEEVQKIEPRISGAYKCLELDDPVYVHPSSVLSKHLPDYIVYQDIFKTSKYFMRTVTTVEPEWLTAFGTNQCEFSAPLETPSPYYDQSNDKIMCSMTSTFSHRAWELPCVVMPMAQGITRYTWFCFFLLDGQVCPMLKDYLQFLISPANVMLKQWARLLPRTRSLLQAVVNKQIDTKETLHKVWEAESTYLLLEYCEWFPESKHLEISCKWPPV